MDKEEQKKQKKIIKEQKKEDIKNAGQIFSKNLKKVMKQNKITQQELATAMGVNDQTLSNWFDNKKGYQPKWVGYMALMFKYLIESKKIKFFEPTFLYKELVEESTFIKLEELYQLKQEIRDWKSMKLDKEIRYLIKDNKFKNNISNLKLLKKQCYAKTSSVIQTDLLDTGKDIYDIFDKIK